MMLCSSMPSFRSLAERAGGPGAFIVAAACVLTLGAAAGPGRAVKQDPRPGATSSTASSFTVFLRTVPIGSETISVDRTAEGWTIRSSGRADVPVDLVARDV